MNETLLAALAPDLRELFLGLTTPNKIQAFLDTVPYAPEYTNRCPLRVLQDRRAHCLDGAIFAAAALRQIGFRPLVVDLLPEPGADDDHVLAIYKVNGAYGAVAQSNYVGLRFREAVYRSLRELVMSYFEVFFNVNGLKTLRWYSAPLNLARFERLNWTVADAGADAVERILPTLSRRQVITPVMAAGLSKLDDLSMRGNMLEIDPSGIYQPKAA